MDLWTLWTHVDLWTLWTHVDLWTLWTLWTYGLCGPEDSVDSVDLLILWT